MGVFVRVSRVQGGELLIARCRRQRRRLPPLRQHQPALSPPRHPHGLREGQILPKFRDALRFLPRATGSRRAPRLAVHLEEEVAWLFALIPNEEDIRPIDMRARLVR